MSFTGYQKGGERIFQPDCLVEAKHHFTLPLLWSMVLVLKAAFSILIDSLQGVFIVTGDFSFRSACRRNNLFSN